MKKFLIGLFCLCACTGAFAKECPKTEGFTDGVTIVSSNGSKKFCLLTRGMQHSAAKGACAAIPSEDGNYRYHFVSKGEVCSGVNAGGKCGTLATGQSYYAWLDGDYTYVPGGEYVPGEGYVSKEDYEEDYEEGYVGLQDMSNRAWHILLEDGNLYHYEKDRLGFPLCY